jgi:hypothetical protein
MRTILCEPSARRNVTRSAPFASMSPVFFEIRFFAPPASLRNTKQRSGLHRFARPSHRHFFPSHPDKSAGRKSEVRGRRSEVGSDEHAGRGRIESFALAPCVFLERPLQAAVEERCKPKPCTALRRTGHRERSEFCPSTWDRRQKTQDRRQKTEVRGQESKVRGRTSEVSDRMRFGFFGANPAMRFAPRSIAGRKSCRPSPLRA